MVFSFYRMQHCSPFIQFFLLLLVVFIKMNCLSCLFFQSWIVHSNITYTLFYLLFYVGHRNFIYPMGSCTFAYPSCLLLYRATTGSPSQHRQFFSTPSKFILLCSIHTSPWQFWGWYSPRQHHKPVVQHCPASLEEHKQHFPRPWQRLLCQNWAAAGQYPGLRE